MLLRNIPCLSHAIRLDPQLQFMVNHSKTKIKKMARRKKIFVHKKRKKNRKESLHNVAQLNILLSTWFASGMAKMASESAGNH